MPRTLDGDFFDSMPGISTTVLDSSDSILAPSEEIIEKGAGLDQLSDYLARRSETFQAMTQGRNKPMTYGGQKVTKRG